MKLKNQVCSLENAKKLKELGVPQDSLWYWFEGANGWVIITKEARRNLKYYYQQKDTCSAFTVAELGEMLPDYIELTDKSCYLLQMNKGHIIVNSKKKYNFTIYYIQNRNVYIRLDAATEADARAKMLIYLIKNKLVNVKELAK